jgi:hypothetical protein
MLNRDVLVRRWRFQGRLRGTADLQVAGGSTLPPFHPSIPLLPFQHLSHSAKLVVALVQKLIDRPFGQFFKTNKECVF